MDTIANPTVIAPPGARRIIDVPGDLADYRASGGYSPITAPADLLDQVVAAGLRGRGGAGFPMGTKLRSVIAHSGPGVRPVVVANGEEGEPASAKDRWLLRHRPHLVLDGLRLAAAILDADRAVVYLSDPAVAEAVTAAIGEAGPMAVPFELHTVAAGYVAGEETAAVRSLNGGEAKPMDKPPRPFSRGVGGRPTLISNVETLANLAWIHRHGAEAFRAAGTAESPGTFLATVTGAGRDAAIYELPHGFSLRELLALHGVADDLVHGALLGGYFNGLTGRRVLDLTLDHETLRAAGTGLGCGAVALLTEPDCPVAVTASVLEYFDRENAGQCGSCFNGIAAMSAVASALRDGTAAPADLERFDRWSTVLRGRGACATLDAATNAARTLLDEFPDAVKRHRDGGCATCATTPFTALRPFDVETVTV
ncbi:putative NADH-ubiquinone oxidoreductase flavoprotein [Nocardia nova SH22a]|uniref:Putative NADH-ubiquinone oxidoreductase flavoprotein n=1 Tax=Nocardia nova SH22a TaxID=1415166 RepID=W5TJ26_9NOCA|nr:NADH-ubiquinone oxidoreductase-F iron-sulfur binding region domain-containing protein [Nocardia nova]AHH18953.1 putative NADH-ubiquinone oxidoreductase flavoprotein [Nocardia nova SH22a]